MSVSSSPSLSPEYDLPAAGDAAAWEALVRPCTGRLQLVEAPGRLGAVASRLFRTKLKAVTVWVHCGVHYLPAPQAGPACTPPILGDLPSVDEVDTRFGFFPLRRDHPAAPPSFAVRVFRAGPGEGLHGIEGRWGVEVIATADADHPLRLCARSQADAEAWAHQLRARLAPLSEVWSRHVGAARGRPVVGSGANVAHLGPAEATQVSAMAALQDGARRVLASDVVGGVAGVMTALVQPEAYNLAVAAGPVVGVALGALGFAMRVLVAARTVFQEAAGVSEQLDELHGKLVEHVLPSLQSLPDDGTVGVGDLMIKLGLLVADMEVLAGELHHLVRSRRQRASLAFLSAHRGGGVVSDLRARLRTARHSADELVQLIQLGLQRRSVSVAVQTRQAVEATSLQVTAMKAVRKNLPPLPPSIFNDWGDLTMPAARLYAAVIQSDSTTCAAVGAHGQGGVGKTLSCLLVAHRVAEEADGRRRFPDGVHWVQLSQDSSLVDVKQRLCDVATTLSGDHVVANDLDVAAGYLQAALQAKSCLLIVDDVWDDRWAATFIGALRTSAGSCLLVSTRRVDIAARTGMSTSVLVGTHEKTSAAGVLLVHAEAGGRIWEDKTDHLVHHAVSMCGGLALALAVMGSLVRERGWASAVELVRRQGDALPSKSLPVEANYQLSLRACLLASYRALGVGVDAIEQPLWHARFQALCVVRPKEQLPGAALAALWGEDDPEVVRQIAWTLQDRSLVTLHGDEANGTLLLSLHDLVIEFLAYPGLMGQAQREDIYGKMMTKYCERNRVGNDSTWMPAFSGPSCVTLRKLWELPSDGYIEHMLPRLLRAGGARGRSELCALLFHWRFIAWRVEVGDGSCGVYRMDTRGHDSAVCVDVLDRVATVVEGALVHPDLALSERLQQAAWEVMERFSSWPRVTDGETEAHLLSLLLASARSYVNRPAVELYGAARLRLPQERRVFGCDSGVQRVCCVHSSGDVILIAGLASGKLNCWEERSGKCAHVLEGHTSAVTCVAALDGGGSEGGGRVVSASADHTLRVWDVYSGECLAVLKGHTRAIDCLVVLDGGGRDGGGRIASKSADHTVRVWEVDSGRCAAVLEGCTGATRCLAALGGDGSGSGARVVSASADYSVLVWHVNSGNCVAALKGHTGLVRCLAVIDGGGSDHGARVVSGSHDLSTRVWDIDSRTCLAVLEGHTNWVRCLAVLDGVGAGGVCRVVSGSADCTLRVWDVDRGTCTAVLKGHTGTVRSVRVLDSGSSGRKRQVVSASADHTLRVWEVDSGVCVSVLNGHTQWVRCLAVAHGDGSGGGGLIVSGSEDDTVRVWEADSSKRITMLESCAGWVKCLAVLDGGGRLGAGRVASGSADHTVRVWDVDRGTCTAVLNGHSDSVRCLVVLDGGGSGGGGRIVTGSHDHTIRVWDEHSGSCMAILEGHSKWVRSLAVLDSGGSNGGRRVVSGSHDLSVRVWDIDSGCGRWTAARAWQLSRAT
ncbi:hypothetical protein I4F81_003904 [Pyropia yezoensis]|uniref:Uncharacterized protein n=1 Tax=Pyropia yezoensis TaxID=2788 RepID=A0ACC3BU94_PYRYE|nr:hypothetical protein I4F81_003904 [Neopyropia yezoensis]